MAKKEELLELIPDLPASNDGVINVIGSLQTSTAALWGGLTNAPCNGATAFFLVHYYLRDTQPIVAVKTTQSSGSLITVELPWAPTINFSFNVPYLVSPQEVLCRPIVVGSQENQQYPLKLVRPLRQEVSCISDTIGASNTAIGGTLTTGITSDLPFTFPTSGELVARTINRERDALTSVPIYRGAVYLQGPFLGTMHPPEGGGASYLPSLQRTLPGESFTAGKYLILLNGNVTNVSLSPSTSFEFKNLPFVVPLGQYAFTLSFVISTALSAAVTVNGYCLYCDAAGTVSQGNEFEVGVGTATVNIDSFTNGTATYSRSLIGIFITASDTCALTSFKATFQQTPELSDIRLTIANNVSATQTFTILNNASVQATVGGSLPAFISSDASVLYSQLASVNYTQSQDKCRVNTVIEDEEPKRRKLE